MSVRLHEEVVAQRAHAVGEHAVWRAAVVGAQHAQAADQHGHFCRGQAHQLGTVEQQLLGADHVVCSSASCGSHRPGAPAPRRIPHRSVPGVASPRPGAKGTLTSTPAALAACSTPTLPASTITSATLAPVSGSDLAYDRQHLGQALGLVAFQSFAGPGECVRRWRRRACPSRGRYGRCPRRWTPARPPTRPAAAIFALTAATS